MCIICILCIYSEFECERGVNSLLFGQDVQSVCYVYDVYNIYYNIK